MLFINFWHSILHQPTTFQFHTTFDLFQVLVAVSVTIQFPIPIFPSLLQHYWIEILCHGNIIPYTVYHIRYMFTMESPSRKKPQSGSRRFGIVKAKINPFLVLIKLIVWEIRSNIWNYFIIISLIVNPALKVINASKYIQKVMLSLQILKLNNLLCSIASDNHCQTVECYRGVTVSSNV